MCRRDTHEFVAKEALVKGRVEMDAVYLGGMLTPGCHPHKERKRIILAARQTWGQLGAFWSADADKAVKRR
eukprot:1673612-Heterocapsa_arctica.AAC.1